MGTTAFNHIALFVPDLRQAEVFYRQSMGMQLLMREAALDDGLWYTLPPDKGWADAEAAGIELDMVALRRGAFILALFQGNPKAEDTVLELGVSMSIEDIAAVRERLPTGATVVRHEYGDLMFRDPFGYLWHLWPAGEAFQSNGESSDRWLSL